MSINKDSCKLSSDLHMCLSLAFPPHKQKKKKKSFKTTNTKQIKGNSIFVSSKSEQQLSFLFPTEKTENADDVGKVLYIYKVRTPMKI